MKKIIYSILGASLAVSASASQNDDSLFTERLLKNNFTPEARTHLQLLQSKYGSESTFMKLQRAMLLYSTNKQEDAKSIFRTIKKTDKLYKESLRIFLNFANRKRDKQGQYEAGKKYYELPSTLLEKKPSQSFKNDVATFYKLSRLNAPKASLTRKLLKYIKLHDIPVVLDANDFPWVITFLDKQEDIFRKKTPGKIETQKLKLLLADLEKLQWLTHDSTYYNFLPLLSKTQLLLGGSQKAIASSLNNFEALKNFEKAIKEHYRKEGRSGWRKSSPVAVSRYVSAFSYIQEAKTELAKKNKKGAKAYIAGGKLPNGSRLKNAALQNLYLVITKYPDHPIAPQAYLLFKEANDIFNTIKGSSKDRSPKFDLFKVGLSEFRRENFDSSRLYLKENIQKFNNGKVKDADSAGNSLLLFTQISIDTGKHQDAKVLLTSLTKTPIASAVSKKDSAKEFYGSSLRMLSAAYSKLGAKKKDALLTKTGKELMALYISSSSGVNALYTVAQTKNAEVRKFRQFESEAAKAAIENAMMAYKKVIKEFPGSNLANNAHKKLAYLYIYKKEEKKAILEFDTYYKNAKSVTFSNKIDRAFTLMNITGQYISLKDTQSARKSLNRLHSFIKNNSINPSTDKDKELLKSFNGNLTFTKLRIEEIQINDTVAAYRKKKTDSGKKELLKAIDQYNKWYKNHPKSNRAPYVLTRLADLYLLEGSANSKAAATTMENLLVKDFPNSAEAKSRTIIRLVNALKKSRTRAVPIAEEMLKEFKAEPKKASVSNLRFIVSKFLFSVQPSTKDVPAKLFNDCSKIANSAALLLVEKSATSKQLPRYQFQLAKSYIFLKKYDKAQNIFDAILKENSRSFLSIDIDFAKALIFTQEGKVEKAVKSLNSIIKKARPQERYDILLQAGTMAAEILNQSKTSKDIKTANTHAFISKDILFEKPTDEQKALIIKAKYLHIITSARLGRNITSARKDFLEKHSLSRYAPEVQKANKIRKEF